MIREAREKNKNQYRKVLTADCLTNTPMYVDLVYSMNRRINDSIFESGFTAFYSGLNNNNRNEILPKLRIMCPIRIIMTSNNDENHLYGPSKNPKISEM